MIVKKTADKSVVHKTILYIGNKLSKHGYTPTNVETLAPLLGEYYEVISVSDKKDQGLRFLDMALAIIKNKNKVSLVIIDTYSTRAFLFARICGALAYKFHIPYVPILHGGDLPRMIKNAPEKKLTYFKKATKLVAPSQYLFQQFQQFGFANLVFIPNNIDLGKYKFKERNGIKPKLLWVRSFHEIYNSGMAIKVLKKLLSQYPDACLCMVGPDKDGSLLKTKLLAGESGVAGKVIFTGMLAQDKWHELSEEYDIFINTTNIDNTPISVIEALALGLPVVSTNVGGIPYLLEHGTNALLVPATDIDAMTDEIKSLLGQPGLALALSGAGRVLTESFDWEKVKSQWKCLIDDVIQ